MDRPQEINPALREWCVGLPLLEIRPLTDVERSGLRRERLVLRIKAWVLLLPFPLVFLVALGFLAIIDPTRNGVVPTAFALLLFAFVFLFGWIATLGVEARRRALAVKGDLRDGTVKRFAGPTGEIDDAPIEERGCQEWEDEPKLLEFEILGFSGRLWTVN